MVNHCGNFKRRKAEVRFEGVSVAKANNPTDTLTEKRLNHINVAARKAIAVFALGRLRIPRYAK
ncbi:hypothetical protein VH13_10010 [Corynebacterium ulcerans]|nr:hypothetical protein D881_11845 [Corynebacterium ulcerans NCTC 12077]KKO84746.1 hypothetical protein VH13_10010 [Corynebacterium ulcerans]KPJ23375.1 hypothetical protein AOT31_10345 [Corynebacterium ulcerans]OAG71081.1 hypothetical protein AFK49_009535 [Corynebacterium ulcerans]